MRIFPMFVIVLAAVFATTGYSPAAAQESVKLDKTPKEFQVFFAKFKVAVFKRRKAAVASMSEFPFEYGYDAGDEGCYTRAEFISKFGRIFSDVSSAFDSVDLEFICDQKGCDVIDVSDASHYRFYRRGSTYKFASYIVEP